MAKGTREIIRLFSSSGNGHFYSTTRNKKSKSKKIELMKFDPIIRRHVKYIENKNRKISNNK